MKAAILLCCALALTHCGTEKVTPAQEGGVDAGSDAGALDAEDELVTQCSFRACDGSVVYCPPITTCPQGDGCNDCKCTLASDGKHYINCTQRPCSCVTAKDGG